MANEELTLGQYYSALQNQRRLLRNQGNGLVNPGVSNNVGELAAMDTSFQQGVDSTNVPTNLKSESKDSILNNVFGFADEIAAKFGAGFVGFFEGLVDLGATGIAAIGENTGWYDTKGIRDFVATDYASRAAEWTKTYGNFTPWGIYNNVKSMAEGNDKTRRNFLGAVFGGPLTAGIQTFREDVDSTVYNQNPETLEQMGQFGQFLGGAAESIGFMLPSIIIGGGVAGAVSKAGGAAAGVVTKGGALAGKAASLASMGLGAAGKGGEEAINEGATSTQALGYGAAKGAVEVASEIVVGKALGGLAKATGLDKFAGTFGKVNGVTFSKELVKKATAKELVTTMIEEGAEEVFSDLFSPICEAIYKGNDAFKQYGSEDYYKQMAMSFASGAFVGGLSSGVQTVSQYRTYGKTGVAYLQNNAEFQEAWKNYKSNPTEENAARVKQLTQSMIDQLDEMANNPAEAKHLENLVNAFVNSESSLSNRVQTIKNELSQENYERLTSDVNRAFEGSTGTEFVWADSDAFQPDENGVVPRALYNENTNQVVLNRAYKDNVMDLVKHEGLSHAILDLAPSIKAKLITAIESNSKLKELYHKYDMQLEQNYSKNELESERLATFTESLLKDFNNVETLLKRNFNVKNGITRLLNRLTERYSNLSKVDRTFVRNVEKAIRALQNQSTTETVKPQLRTQAASKPLTTVDSQGNKLSEKQQEYFKDSKARDKNGNLVPVYHSSRDFGFTKFDEDFNDGRQHGFYFSNDKNVANSYVGDLIEKDIPHSDYVIKTYGDILNKLNLTVQEFDKKLTDIYEILDFNDLGICVASSLNEQQQQLLIEFLNSYEEDGYKQWGIDKKYDRFANSRTGEILGSELLDDTYWDIFTDAEMGNKDDYTYKVYLNLKNPYIIDGRRSNWSRIPSELLKANKKTIYSNIIRNVSTHRIGGVKIRWLDGPKDLERQFGYNKFSGHYDEVWKLLKQGELRHYTFKGLSSQLFFNYAVKNGEVVKLTYEQIYKDVLNEYEKTSKVADYKKIVDALKTAKTEEDIKAIREQYTAFKKNGLGPQIHGYFDLLNAFKYYQPRGTTRQVVAEAYKKGYDGVIFRNIYDVGSHGNYDNEGYSDIYVAFNSNQIKNVDNKNPTEDKDIRYSKPLDTLPKELSDKIETEFTKKVDDLVHAGATVWFNKGEGITKAEIKKSGIKNKSYSVTYKKMGSKNKWVVNYDSIKDVRNAFYSVVTIGKTYSEVKLNKPVVEKTKEVKSNERRKKNSPIEGTYFEHGINDKKTRFKIYKIGDRYELQYFDHVLTKGVVGGKTVEKTFGSGKVDYVREGGTEIEFDSLENVKKYLEQIKAVRKDEKDWRTMHENKTRKVASEKSTIKEAEKKQNAKIETKQKVEVEENKPTYKSMAETGKIVDLAKKIALENFDEGFKIAFPKNLENFTSRAFTELNTVKSVRLEAEKIAKLFYETTVRELNEEGKYVTYSTLGEMLSDKQKTEFVKSITEIIENAADTNALSKATRSFEMSLNKALNTSENQRASIHATRFFTNQRRLIKDLIKRDIVLDTNEVAKNGIEMLLYPIQQTKANYSGADSAFKAKDLRANFEAVRSLYEKIGENPNLSPDIPYHPEVVQLLDEIIDSIGQPVTQNLKNGTSRDVYGGIQANTLELINDYIVVAKYLIKETRNNIRANVQPNANQTYNAIKSSTYADKDNFLAKGWRMYKRGFAPAYINLAQTLGGNSYAAKLLTTDMQMAMNNKTLYTGMYNDSFKSMMKKLGISKTFDTKTVRVAGADLTVDQAMYLYNSLNVQANYEAIDKSGVKYKDENNRTQVLVESGNAETLKNEINNALPDNYKKFADFLLGTMNGKVKGEYIDYYEKTFGKYNGRNEIGQINENTYWTLKRAYDEGIRTVEKAYKNPDAIFSNSKSRTGVDNYVMAAGALNTVTTYIDRLGTELYLKPKYREAVQLLNTKTANGQTVYQLLNNKVDAQDLSYLSKTMDDMVGALKPVNDLFTALMSRFSVAKLSLNVGTIFKQYASIFTSNISMRSRIKGILAKMFNAEAKAEFQKLVGNDPETALGGLKYRKAGSSVIDANADNLSGMAKKIAKAGMTGITTMDAFTVSVGVYSLMAIGENQYGYKIGSQENIDFVREHWAEFELSQIGSGALSKNALSRGDYGAIAKSLFSFLQGANRAALGSQINKYNLWKRNHNLDEAALNKNLSDAKSKVEAFEKAHQEDGKFNAGTLTEEEGQEYSQLKTSEIDAQMKVDDYKRFKVAGGKFIPTNMVAGLAAQAVLISLVNELMRRLKGKKDWDEWDLMEMLGNFALALGVDWVPLLNTASSMVQGYEVQVPAVEIFNEVSSIFSAGKDGNWEKALRQLIVTLGDMTGIPVQTLYQYVYGITKEIDPSTAFEMNSFLYGVSSSTATKNMNSYIEKGNTSKALQMMSTVMDNFRVRSSESAKREVLSLYQEGYTDVLPKQYMTEYTNENGENVKLTASQIQHFREIYDESDEKVSKLINRADYSALTSEEKSKMLKKLYSAYYDYAKISTAGVTANTSRLGQLLYGTNGNVDLSRYLTVLNKISTISASKKKSRKELVISYVNKLKGLSTQEKLLILNLAGYSTSDKNEKQLVSYLVSKGMSRKQALEFVQ